MTDLVLITGGSSDLGIALARRLLSAIPNVSVICHAHTGSARIHELQAEFGDRVHPVLADFRDPASINAMSDEIAAKFGVPTQIVHLPALRLQYERFTKFNLEHFRQDMAIQVEAAVILLQRFAPKMSRLPTSRVVFVLSSIVHSMPPKFMSMYTVIKYAQLGLMRAVAAEYATTSLTCNAVSPSMIETQFLGDISEIAIKMSAAASPKGRNAHPDDVLGAIEFLLSPGAAYITGIDIPITAGSNC